MTRDDSHGICTAEHASLSDATLLHLHGSIGWHDGNPVGADPVALSGDEQRSRDQVRDGCVCVCVCVGGVNNSQHA